MFAEACTIAREYTKPIIISYRKFDGSCSAGIGTLVVINDDGWFVTAGHIIQMIANASQSVDKYNQLLAIRTQIENDTSIKANERFRRLNQNKIPLDSITNFSVWCGYNGLGVTDTSGIPEVDLAIGKIHNFDKSTVKIYPTFKDPMQKMEPGRSLCKMGFPFHNIQPTFDSANNMFSLPPGAVPLPFFPIEGIFTRVSLPMPLPNQPVQQRSYPLMLVETSSPGLKGQSGGPTFDVHGNIWAIQSSTTSYPLGFEANKQMNSKQAEHIKNQYLHVGLGVHSETIIGYLKEKNISFNLSLR